MRVLSLEEAAARLDASPRSLADKRYRIRLGLHGTKIGKRLVFTEDEVTRVITKGRERLPVVP